MDILLERVEDGSDEHHLAVDQALAETDAAGILAVDVTAIQELIESALDSDALLLRPASHEAS